MLFVGMIKNATDGFATFMVGDFVNEDDGFFVLRNVIRVMELPTQTGTGLSFLCDHFFTVDQNTPIRKSNLIMHRILDPECDAKMIAKINSFYVQLRAQRSGLVTPQLNADEITQKVLNETK